MSNLGEKIMKLRKEAGLSQEELGEKLNVTRQTVSKWELGDTTPEINKLTELSKIFNVSMDELLNEGEELNRNNSNPISGEGNGSRSDIVKLLLIGLLIALICAGSYKYYKYLQYKRNERLVNNIINTGENFVSNIIDKGREMDREDDESYNQVTNTAIDTFNNVADKMYNSFEQRSNEMDDDFEQKSNEMYNKFEQKSSEIDEMYNNFLEKKDE